LGLSIVKRLAEAMGGTVRCESKLGEGAIFIFQVRPVPKELIAGKTLAATAPVEATGTAAARAFH
jgi:hypothetical protein